MIQQLSFLKENSARLIFVIFIANVFYDDPTLYLYKRIGYSICIYYAIWEIIRFYYENRLNPMAFKMPTFYNLYLPLVGLFVLIALYIDFTGPNLKFITLLNNPFALLMVFPIFIFAIGAQADDLEQTFKVMIFASLVCVLVAALPFFGKVKYYQGYICANAFVPMFFLSWHYKKYRWLGIAGLVGGLYFSQISDYRIIALRILLFVSLLVGLTMFRKSGIIKTLILLTCCFGLYQFLVNIEDLLALFKDIIGVKSFDDDDTRGFLWTEVFGELKGNEFIYGRGFLGTYFSEYFLMILVRYRTYGDHYERFSVEVGFLELILKGGFLWYILYIMPLLYTSIKGIFWHYKDPLIFAISIFLMTELLLMFIENIPYFSFQFSLLFFLAGFAFKKMREYDRSKNQLTLRS